MRMTTSRKALTTLALAGSLALSVSACSSNSAGSGSDTNTPAAAATPAAVLANLTGVTTAVKLDQGFVDGLTSLKLTPGVIGTAKLTDGSLIFPITGGNATYWTPGTHDPYVEGKIMHDGSGISLTDGKTKVSLENFVVDPGTSMLTGKVSANGSVVAESAPLFFLDGSTLQPLKMEDGHPVLEGTTVSLTKTAADLLNKTYGTTALTEFFKVGVAKITLSGS